MPDRRQAGVGLLDAVLILLLACLLDLLLLWISGVLQGRALFGTLPDWLTHTASSLWTYLTGGASSLVLALLRGNANGERPNYLLWIGGTAMVMLCVIVGLGHVPVRSDPGSDLLLRFSLKCDKADRPNLSFFQKQPKYRESHTIAAEPSADHYQEYVDFPAPGERFYARAVRSVATSQAMTQPVSPVTELCFKRNPKPPGNSAPFKATLECTEGKHCAIGVDDPGWIGGCSADVDWTTGLFQMVPLVYADSRNVEAGWKVPSLATLKTMTARERVGYTEFSLRSAQLSGLKEADSFQYVIRANGSPLYVDGWAPEDMVKPFDASQPFAFSFGLENLSFSGADDGCERITVELRFRQKERVVKEAIISRRYAALRDAESEEVKAADGTSFSWSGKYVKPQKEDGTELFVLSTPDLREAKQAKARIEAASLSYERMDVVAVLRPPLNNPQYGLVLGLRQPTGQIRFTYDASAAQALRSWVAAQQAHNRQVFRRDIFLYQMRPGDSGTGALGSCSAAASGRP